MAMIIAAAGRALITGLALYGAKKLYDEYLKPDLDDSEMVQVSETVVNSKNESMETKLGTEFNSEDDERKYTLNENLENFFSRTSKHEKSDEYASAKEEISSIVREVLNMVHPLMNELCPAFRFSELERVGEYTLFGSSTEAYDIIKPD